MTRVVREVGVHLADDVDRLVNRALDAVDVRAAEPASIGPVHDVDAARMLAREVVRDLAGAVRRLVVHDEHADVGLLQQALDQRRQVLALVVGRDDDERARRRHRAAPRTASNEICSETRPTRKITTLSRISSTEEFVTCDCVAIVHAA